MTLSCRSVRIAALLLAAGASSAAAQGVVMPVADLNTGPNQNRQGSQTRTFDDAATLGTRTFFAASTPESGIELWVTDGTPSGTTIFADLCPGICGSAPRDFHVEGNQLFFAANDGVHGVEPHVVGVADAAPRLVADLNPGIDGSSPTGFQRLTFRINATTVTRTFFSATRNGEGRELWRLAAGTTPTVSLERDLVAGPGSGDPIDLAVLNTFEVALLANDAAGVRHVQRLAYTSTTAPASGADIVAGFDTGPTRRATALRGLGSNVFAVINVGSNVDQLWVTQGTTASTRILVGRNLPIRSLTINTQLARLFFVNGIGNGTRLGSTDGTPLGTVEATGVATIEFLTAVGPRAVFFATGCGGGRELCSNDGTVAGNALVREFAAGTAGAQPQSVARVGGAMVIGLPGELWRSDGTPAGTVSIGGAAMSSGNAQFITPVSGSDAIVGFQGTGSSDAEPLFARVAAGSTVALGNLRRDVGDSVPFPLGVVGDRVLVEAYVGGAFRSGLGVSTAVPSLPPEALPTFNDPLAGFIGGRGVIAADGRLALTDGTAAGTTLIDTVAPALGARACIVRLDGVDYFLGQSPDDRTEVYRTDGTIAGTVPVSDASQTGFEIEPNCSHNDTVFARIGDRLMFERRTPTTGFEPHVFDPATGDTTLLADIRPGISGAVLRAFTTLGERVVFTANDGVFGEEPWVTDGSAQGTQRLADIAPDGTGSQPRELVRVGGQVIFAATSPAGGRELYRTDGTVAGTRRIVDLFAGSGSALTAGDNPHVVHGDRLWFAATGSAEPDCVLYETDGTAAGTRCAFDSTTTRLGPVTSLAATASGVIVFGAVDRDGGDGDEVRALFNRAFVAIDGHDIAPGAAGSAPTAFVADGDDVYFQANDGITGRELWWLAMGDVDSLFRNGFE